MPESVRTLRYVLAEDEEEEDGCEPYPDPLFDRKWIAGAYADETGEAEFLLLNQSGANEASQQLLIPFHTYLIFPDGRVFLARAQLRRDQGTYVNFPDDFIQAKETVFRSGAYTVVWTTEDGGFLACSGLRGFRGEPDTYGIEPECLPSQIEAHDPACQ